MSEEILGIYPGWIDRGGRIIRKVWTCKLVFTTSRLILAEEKRFGGFASVLYDPYYVSSKANARERLKMKEMSVEGILEANAENFDIPYSSIAAVETKISTGPTRCELLVFTPENLDIPKYKFDVRIWARHMSDFQEFLRTVLPDKV